MERCAGTHSVVGIQYSVLEIQYSLRQGTRKLGYKITRENAVKTPEKCFLLGRCTFVQQGLKTPQQWF